MDTVMILSLVLFALAIGLAGGWWMGHETGHLRGFEKGWNEAHDFYKRKLGG